MTDTTHTTRPSGPVTLHRVQPQFWRVAGRLADGTRLQRIVYAAGNVQAEAQACQLAGCRPEDLIEGSCIRIDTPDFTPTRMPGAEFPPQAQAQAPQASTSQADDDHGLQVHIVFSGKDFLYAAGAVGFLAASVLLAADALPFLPTVANQVARWLP